MEKNKDNKYGQKGKYHDYEIGMWADGIITSEKIKKDPDKMKYVAKCLEEKAKDMKAAVTSIDDLRDKYKEKVEDDHYS